VRSHGPKKPFCAPDETILAERRSQPETSNRQHGAAGQTTGFDHVGNYQFDLSGILLRSPAGNAMQLSTRQSRVKAPFSSRRDGSNRS
jgi:hypothetical protein